MVANRVSIIDGVRITQFKSTSDIRGTFIKLHPLSELGNSLDSVALSFNPNPGTIRGLHFQVEPFAEEKLITCVQGAIFDVIVDLRPNSKTLAKWKSFVLSAENGLQIYLPKGVAHGFQTLMSDSIVHYSLTSVYSPKSSYSISPFCDLGFEWPLKDFIVSDRDMAGVSVSLGAQKYSESLEN